MHVETENIFGFVDRSIKNQILVEWSFVGFKEDIFGAISC